MTLTMIGRLSECLLFSYSTPEDRAKHLVPPGLHLVTHRGHAFWNIVVSTIEAMRPRGLPRWSGITYHHVAYRLHVRARPERGEPLQGLYFLRSDVNSSLISRFGNVLSDFQLHRAAIDIVAEDSVMRIHVTGHDPAGHCQVCVKAGAHPPQAAGSVFESSEERERFLKYQPLGLAIGKKGEIRLAEVMRDEAAWTESPVHVEAARWGFLDSHDQGDCTLERATRVLPLDYRWRLGRGIPMSRAPAQKASSS